MMSHINSNKIGYSATMYDATGQRPRLSLCNGRNAFVKTAHHTKRGLGYKASLVLSRSAVNHASLAPIQPSVTTLQQSHILTKSALCAHTAKFAAGPKGHNQGPLQPRNTGRPPLTTAASASTGSPATCQPFSGADLAKYIQSGPLQESCGITPESITANIGEWERLGRQLARQLEFDHDHMDPIQRLRIYHYYLPVYMWVAGQFARHRQEGHTEALVLGISAPQGCGKTTLVEQLERLFAAQGTPAASVSIDDFYLTHADQNALATAHPASRLLQMRGNAGTHDLGLGTETLRRLRGLRMAGDSAAVPRYDKSAYGGRGDRAPKDTWPVVSGPLDLVLFEGWMSGFAPVQPAAAATVDPALEQVNTLLGSYRTAWDELVDSWLVIRIGDPQWVYRWRQQAEERMKAGGRPGMSDEQVADFVSRFMPAYKAYLPGLYDKGPTTARSGRTLIIEVDQHRSPVLQQPAPVV